MKIINLTQHAAAADQTAAGVVEPSDKKAVSGLLTFDTPPTSGEMVERAHALVAIAMAVGADAAMIGGAPFFMSTLERALREAGVRPLYAFSRRESVDESQADGTVKKVAVFRHAGWVEV